MRLKEIACCDSMAEVGAAQHERAAGQAQIELVGPDGFPCRRHRDERNARERGARDREALVLWVADRIGEQTAGDHKVKRHLFTNSMHAHASEQLAAAKLLKRWHQDGRKGHCRTVDRT